MSFLKKFALIILLVPFSVYSVPENVQKPALVVTRSYPSVSMPHEVSFFSSTITNPKELSQADYKIDCFDPVDIGILMALEAKKIEKAFLLIKENIQFNRLVSAIKSELDRFASREKYRKKTVSVAFFFLDSSKNILLKLDFDKKDGKKGVSVSLFSADDVPSVALMNLATAMLCDELFVQKYWKNGLFCIATLGLGLVFGPIFGPKIPAGFRYLKQNALRVKNASIKQLRRVPKYADFGMTYLEGCKMYLDKYHPGCFDDFENLGYGHWLATHTKIPTIGCLLVLKTEEILDDSSSKNIAQLSQLASKEFLYRIIESSIYNDVISCKRGRLSFDTLNCYRNSDANAILTQPFQIYSKFKETGLLDVHTGKPTDFLHSSVQVCKSRYAYP